MEAQGRRITSGKRRHGFTLMESIVALFLVTIMAILLVQLVGLRPFNRRLAFRAQAAALADEATNALRRLSFASLSDQTNGPILNVLYNAGRWQVIADGNQGGANHTTPNALELALPAGAVSGLSGQLLLPAGGYQAVTVTAKWKVVSDSPTNWAVGYQIRSRDARNSYRLLLAASATDLDGGTVGTQNVVLERITNGAISVMRSSALAGVAMDSWFALLVSVTATGEFSASFDGTALFSPVTDTTFTSGPAALIGWNGVHAEVDDVQITTTATEAWDFDSSLQLPTAWIRLGINDLPDSTPTAYDDNGTLTLEPYPTAGATTLKRALVTISWVDARGGQSFTTTTLVGQSNLGL